MPREFASAAAATFLALLPIVNPVGNLPLFVALSSEASEAERRSIAWKASRNVILILGTFLLIGRFLLHFFGISLPVLRVAGGLIVGHTAWRMVTGRGELSEAEHTEAVGKESISLVPLAIPILAGPGAIGVVIALSAHMSHWSAYIGHLLGVTAVGLAIALVLRMGEPMARRLGHNRVGVLNRLSGLLILAIAVQLVADGAVRIVGTST
ncbi:MAG: MarC family protein [Actinomycetota bacterium]|nr:MarC family protein [Actinomycetota bacterium]